MLSIVTPVVGAVMIAAVLRELFHTLVHPAGRGPLSFGVFRLIRRLARRRGDRAVMLAGPLAMVLTIALWGSGLVVGWALVYWPFLPKDFAFSSALAPAAQDSFIDALYLSMVTQPESVVFGCL